MTLLERPNSVKGGNSLAALEVFYLSAVLQSLPAGQKFALDVGAHQGDVTEALAHLGFKVLAVEPQDYMADRFARKHAARIDAGTVRLARCAASDRQGEAELIIGSASTLSTLEPTWTSRAFPEEFRNRRTMRVPVLPVSVLLREQEFGPVAFAKIDVEGHELSVLRGLFTPDLAPPHMVMFEACRGFEEQCAACLQLLASNGYRTFDIFVRIGPDPIAGERFAGPSLPAAWHACERFFYANVIAYHESFKPAVPWPDPVQFVRDYEQGAPGRFEGLPDAIRTSAAGPSPQPSNPNTGGSCHGPDSCSAASGK